MPLEQAIQDRDRVEYFEGALDALLAAKLEDGVDVRAYFGWSIYCQPSGGSIADCGVLF